MILNLPFFTSTARAALALALGWAACGQTPLRPPVPVLDWDKPPVLPRNFDLLAFDANSATSPTARGSRIRLFRMMPGFLSDPVGLDQDDPTANDPDAQAPTANNGPDWVQLSLGNDNPFFDFRRPGDPGGVGYYRVNSQLQLFDSRSTGCAFNLQAVTPAGRDMDGLPDGPTVVTPALSVFHELDDGTAIQGFVGKHVNLAQGWSNNLNRSVHYGMAVQRPLLDPNTLKLGAMYWYVGALGRYRFDTDPASSRAPTWELMPGVHWQVTDNWWIASGFIVPVKQPQTDTRLWQFTCSFRF